ncbi:hypothetical protein [Klebsiella phage KL01]|uniref:Uncharacterized protein n=1 Tax=Klebsiella phage KL01 TaxID=3077152 RepID=A0AA96T4S8_9CAUD|nr:hypothetical protein [Klebsiella phage KL01]GGH32462.1 hypothetical protein GCM10011418_45990 [Sphingobacterium alkalisoli]
MKAVFIGGQEHGREMELGYLLGSIRFPVKGSVYAYVGSEDKIYNPKLDCLEYVLHRQLMRSGKEDLLIYTPANFTYEQILAALLNY